MGAYSVDKQHRYLHIHTQEISRSWRTPTLRQHIISALCTLLRIPFALLDILRTPFVQRARTNPRSIVIIKPCCLGDLIMTTPLLEVLRHAYPDARITYVAGSWSKVIPEHHPAVDEVIDCGSVGISGRYSTREYFALAKRLRAYHFDLAFVLDRSPMLTLLPWLAGVPRRVGPDSQGRGFSLTDRVAVSSSLQQLEHEADIYLDLARALKLPLEQPGMRFVPTENERAKAQRYDGIQIAVFVGGGSNPGMDLTAKRWPLERYRALVQKLVWELGARVLLIGGPSDAPLTRQLLEGLEVPAGSVLDRAGSTSIGELGAQLEACSLYIGNDSSPMHMAAAVGIPVIGIFGPTSPTEYGPYPTNDPKHIGLWKHPTGQPCFFQGKMRECHNCTCMSSITVDDVWQAVQRLLPSTSDSEVRR
ncbi:lipopolysaccharide heptosyltransferase II [Ktedonospora formicarum]|uniref:lipopolysaccharide heptosyltransferase II n=1 Tax=Ktedonospora formicarum TaxID=2778364 RepID=A0A8J3MRJ2_9CHLR|nr:lipopolysaccharide heptosyltransferase II [Ktedonospora formicarum]GHO45115.1 lipopolysaccharide heptosyltransferase II [Ktedonospora formicarum]